MPELPEERIEQAEVEAATEDHSHQGVADATTLGDHLAREHDLAPAEDLSPATQKGLHDRVHQTSDAADDDQ